MCPIDSGLVTECSCDGCGFCGGSCTNKCNGLKCSNCKNQSCRNQNKP